MSLDAEAVVLTAARTVHRKYYGFVDLADLQQEGRIWLWQHQSRVDAMEERAENEGAAANWVKADVTGRLEKYARAQKAHVSGYSPDDEQFYGAGIIAAVLPKVLTGDREAPSGGTDGLPRAQNDPAESGTWMALFADVTAALRALDDKDVHLLVDRYLDELTYDEIARRWEWASTDTAHKAVARAERHLIDKLGGSKPRDCSPETCEHLSHSLELRRRPGSRKEEW